MADYEMETLGDGSLASGDGDAQNGKPADESRVEDDDGRAHKKRMTVRHISIPGPLESLRSITGASTPRASTSPAVSTTELLELGTAHDSDDRAAFVMCSATTGRPYISLCQVAIVLR